MGGPALAARPRLLVSIGIGVALAFVVPGATAATRFLIAWDGGSLAYLILIVAMMARSDEGDMQSRADREDTGAAAVLALTVTGSLASLVAIGAELGDLHGAEVKDGLRVTIAASTILLSWLFVHTAFAVHYAHDYYAGEDDRRGLKFPTDEKPDYWDFLYFSFNLGAAAQTSDVVIESARMRRLVLGHTILSFLFNTTILALAINVGAGLI